MPVDPLHNHTYSLFSGKKAPKKFDVEKIFEETRRSAREYTQQIAGRWFSTMNDDVSCFAVNQKEICIPFL